MKRAFLTFSDPRLETLEDKSAGVCRSLKRSQEDNLDHQVEKDELTSGLADSGLREAEIQNQLHQLQGCVASLEVEIAKSKLHNEHLRSKDTKGWQSLKTAAIGQQAEAAIQGLREKADKYLEMAGHAEIRTQEALEETKFWKERFVKLA
ncbi:hypothetical protein CR513_09592, partial [Mucuna pruriens]